MEMEMETPSVLAIDPGLHQSAVVRLNSAGRILAHCILANEEMAETLRTSPISIGLSQDCSCAIEMVASYGMPVGREVFSTVLWIGRFIELIEATTRRPVDLIERREVRLAICGSSRANDAAIRRAIIDMYGTCRADAIGYKRQPGPLYGLRRDEWAALAVAVTWMRRHCESWTPQA